MELKDQIRIAREAAGYTQAELAHRLGVSKQSIIWWEEGEHRPKTTRIRSMEEALNVRLDLAERGDATPLDTSVLSLSVDPETLRVAVAIGRLPQSQREAIKTLVFIGESKSLGTTSPFTENSGKERSVSKAKQTPVSDTIEVASSPATAEEFNFVEKRKKNEPQHRTTVGAPAIKRTAGRRP